MRNCHFDCSSEYDSVVFTRLRNYHHYFQKFSSLPTETLYAKP